MISKEQTEGGLFKVEWKSDEIIAPYNYYDGNISVVSY